MVSLATFILSHYYLEHGNIIITYGMVRYRRAKETGSGHSLSVSVMYGMLNILSILVLNALRPLCLKWKHLIYDGSNTYLTRYEDVSFSKSPSYKQGTINSWKWTHFKYQLQRVSKSWSKYVMLTVYHMFYVEIV